MAENDEILKAVQDVGAKVKSDQEKLSKEIEGRIDNLNAQIKDGNKLHQDQKSELQNMVTKYNEMQKQIDALDLDNQKANKYKGSTTFNVFKHVLENNKEIITALREGHTKNAPLKFDKKSFANFFDYSHKNTTMIGSNTLTGDVGRQLFIPGIIYDPDRPTHVRSVMSVIATNSSSIRYMQETGITDATDATAEGNAYGQSDVDIEEKTASIVKIGTYLTASKELLDDVDGFSGYLMQRFGKKLRVKEDQQLLYGTGSGAQLTGITNTAGIKTYSDVFADANTNRIDVLVRAVSQLIEDHYRPNAIMLNPQDAMRLRLEKATDGKYLFPEGVMGGAPLVINGAVVLENSAVTAGDFIVGDFVQGLALFDRYEPEILLSTEHASNFISDLVTIVVSEKVAMPVYRPSAFLHDSFAASIAEGTA